ncbi:T9SS type A sorting domain-containing protein, partial [Calditrichota bacterium]
RYSSCLNTGDPQYPPDPDSTRADRGWMYCPTDISDGQPTEIFANPTTDEVLSATLQFINRTTVPFFVSPSDYRANYSISSAELGETLGDTMLTAIIKVEDQYYIAGGGGDRCKIYVTDIPVQGEVSEFDQPGSVQNGCFLDLTSDGGDILYGCTGTSIVEFTTSGEFGDEYSGPDDVGDYTGLTADFTNSYQYVDFYLGTNEGYIVRLDSEFGEEERYYIGRPIRALAMKHNERALYVVTENLDSASVISLFYPDEDRLFDLQTLDFGVNTQVGGIEVDRDGILSGILEGLNGEEDKYIGKRIYTPWLVTPHRWQMLMPGESVEWEFLLDGRQVQPGDHHVYRNIMVNGYFSDYLVNIKINNLSVDGYLKDEYSPQEFGFTSVYPNPFNSRLNLNLLLPTGNEVKLQLFDLGGRSVRLLEDGWYAPGSHFRSYDLNSLTSGSYLVKLSTPELRATRNVILVK